MFLVMQDQALSALLLWKLYPALQVPQASALIMGAAAPDKYATLR
jgi:hypothetical protein